MIEANEVRCQVRGNEGMDVTLVLVAPFLCFRTRHDSDFRYCYCHAYGNSGRYRGTILYHTGALSLTVPSPGSTLLPYSERIACTCTERLKGTEYNIGNYQIDILVRHIHHLLIPL